MSDTNSTGLLHASNLKVPSSLVLSLFSLTISLHIAGNCDSLLTSIVTVSVFQEGPLESV